MVNMTMKDFDGLDFGKGDAAYRSPERAAIETLEIGQVTVVDDTGCGGASGLCPTEDALVLVRRELNAAADRSTVNAAGRPSPRVPNTKRFEIRHLPENKVAVACKARE